MLEFLEGFSAAKDDDAPEIERLLRPRPIYQQPAANPHIVDSAEAAECAKTAPEKIPVGNVARTLQPKQHYVGELQERGSAACVLVEFRKKATQIRKIGTHI